jgi:hypothetical protein
MRHAGQGAGTSVAVARMQGLGIDRMDAWVGGWVGGGMTSPYNVDGCGLRE